MDFRIGTGYDVHAFRDGRPLILGGVKVPYHSGLDGHSDADVLSHAVMDALLGSLSLGDIGTHFPPGDPEYKDISSLFLMESVLEMVKSREFKPCNLDSIIVAQQPKLSPFLEEMRYNIAQILEIEKELVSVKVTTTDKLGFIGRQEGMAAYATVLLKKNR